MKQFLVILFIGLLLFSLAGCDSEESEEYTLTLKTKGPGTVTPEPSEYTYDKETKVPLKAKPNEDGKFDKWEGNVTEPEKEETKVLVNKNLTVTAIFEEETSPSIDPESVEFNKNEPEDIEISINWGGASEIENISQNQEPIDDSYYSLTDDTLVISKDFLEDIDGDCELVIIFEDGQEATLTIEDQSSLLDNNLEKSFELDKNYIVEGDLYLEAGTLDLNGYKLDIRGGLYLVGGNMKFNGGQIELEDNFELTDGKLELDSGKTLNVPGSANINGGTLDLNEGHLKITENLLHSGGTIKINSGNLEINEDYRIQSQKDDGFDESSGVLSMQSADDSLRVDGDFITQSTESHKDKLKNGTFKLEGDFRQIDGHEENFAATEDHVMVFCGNYTQAINFATPIDSYFQRLEIDQGDYFETNIKLESGLKLSSLTSEDEIFIHSEYSKKLYGNIDILVDNLKTSYIKFKGERIDFNGGNMEIDNLNADGNVELNGGTMNLPGEQIVMDSGQLNLSGGTISLDQLKIGSSRNTQATGNIDDGTVVTNRLVIDEKCQFNMTKANGYVLVGEDFVNLSDEIKDSLAEGTIELYGKIYDYTFDENMRPISAGEDLKFVFSNKSDTEPEISFKSEDSYLHDLYLLNFSEEVEYDPDKIKGEVYNIEQDDSDGNKISSPIEIETGGREELIAKLQKEEETVTAKLESLDEDIVRVEDDNTLIGEDAGLAKIKVIFDEDQDNYYHQLVEVTE
ncbi:MAG: X2-like carbohydrate binding domain-containing protein [Bacillota bacterium]